VASPDLTALAPFLETPQPGQEKLLADQPALPPTVDVWGYTTAEHPTLWFYMPYSTAQQVPVNFSIEEEEGKSAKLIYEDTISLPSKPGLISIQLPKNKPGLQPRKHYRWLLAIKCKPQSGSLAGIDSPSVDGLIIRRPMDAALANQLATASGSSKAALYANNGFWFDALNTLAELRRQNPQDPGLAADWQSLLESMNLSKSGTFKHPKPFDAIELAKQPFANPKK
jgi:hypothetical protein